MQFAFQEHEQGLWSVLGCSQCLLSAMLALLLLPCWEVWSQFNVLVVPALKRRWEGQQFCSAESLPGSSS